MENGERRDSAREKILMPVNILFANGGGKTLLEGFILDISASGCLILADLSYFVDRNVHLTFRMPWTDQEVQARAKVIRCSASRTGIQSGLQFSQLFPEARMRLLELINWLKDVNGFRAVLKMQNLTPSLNMANPGGKPYNSLSV
jgi:hypothetical protein